MNLQAVCVLFYIVTLLVLWLTIVVGDDKKLMCMYTLSAKWSDFS